jgi:glycosyltransferase involved in cell wall biosynthesis
MSEAAPIETSPIEVSVVVLSYDRVHLLKRTLNALLDPEVARGVPFELIVADNHIDRLAEAFVTDFAAKAPFPVRYLADGARNYSIVRNLGIKAARGRYVAFVDDDEEPQPGWLWELHACLERTGADAAFGIKRPLFESGGPPDWDPTASLFTTDRQEPQDTEIHMFGRLRRPGKGLGTGNSIFRVATCLDAPEPFAIPFGFGAGEDTHLLFRLAQAGKRFIWCPAAVVVEFMESDRIRPSYMLQRFKRGSQHYASVRVLLSRRRTLTLIKVSLLGAAQICVHLALYILTAPFAGPKAFLHRIGMAKGLGKLTWRKPIGFIDERAA